MLVRAAIACVLLAVAGAGCADSKETFEARGAPPVWPAPQNPMELTRKAGLTPERAEFLEYHVHAHLDVFFNGDHVVVPAGIGINTRDPAVQADSTGVGLLQECEKPCISPLHTHAPDGVLHTETKTPAPNTLGQFFAEWGVALGSVQVGEYSDTRTALAFYLDGEAFEGDPRKIELSDGKEITIVIGSAPDDIPSEFPQNQ
jgi:hypothetical protein